MSAELLREAAAKMRADDAALGDHPEGLAFLDAVSDWLYLEADMPEDKRRSDASIVARAYLSP